LKLGKQEKMINAQNITRHELIGLRAEVIKARNKSAVGIRGTIVDETKSTLEIDGKKVFKSGSVFKLTLPNKTKVEIEGEKIEARPWERIKKKRNG